MNFLENNKQALITIIVFFFILLLNFCTEPGVPPKNEIIDYTAVPEGFPPIPYPDDNPITPEKVELGRRLFYEKLLSRDKDIPSCSHCLKQPNAFCDFNQVSRAADRESEYRNTMTLANVAYRKNLFWDGRGSKIESPAYRSLWMPNILAADTNVIVNRLLSHPLYPDLFRKAFGRDVKISGYLISQAIATFIRTFISGNSPFDKFTRGDSSALSQEQIRGKDLFFGKANCSKCHSDFLFTDGKFHNTGITTHYFDRGRYYITKVNSDRGKFLTPTLRNIEVTAPYMHDGTIPTLELVIEHYNTGGKPFINKDTLMKTLNLSQREKEDLISFLKSLTDWEFLKNKRFSNPD